MEKPTSMFAWRHSSATNGVDKHLHFTASTPLPPQRSGTILIKVLYTCLNPIDYKLHEIPLAHLLTGRPATLGSDFVGRVVETIPEPGVSTQQYEPGQLVVGKLGALRKHGTLAEYVVIKPSKKEPLIPVDESAASDKLAELAGIPTAGTTALRSLRGVPRGGRVFINGGSGGTGTFGIQIAKHVMGLEVVTSCSARNIPYVLSLGADEAIDYTKEDVPMALEASVRRAGRKFDLIVDNVGTNSNLYWRAPAYLALPGEGTSTLKHQYITVGAPVAATAFFRLLAIYLWPRVLGGGKHDAMALTTPPTAEDLREMVGLVMEGKVRTEKQVYELEKAVEAVGLMRSGRARGKIVVRVGG